MKRKQPKNKPADGCTSTQTTTDPAHLLEQAISILRQRIRQGYSANDSCVPAHFTEEKRKLSDIISRTGLYGESNSLLVTGPRGGGKSVLVKSVLNELSQNEEITENLLIVYLNGLLQTDDNIALKEITRQLQLENAVGDRVFGSFSETLQFLLQSLRSGDQSTKSILFVLEEFDLFAQHRNQTLLYNLFDISQSAQTPICVIGLTCRLQLRDDQVILDILQRHYQSSKELRDLQKLVTYPICQLSPDHPQILSTDFIDGFKISSVDSKSALVKGLSILELCLIIAMKHLTEIYDNEPFNFEMVYNEYQKFFKQKASIQHFERPVVLKAFEHLMALEVVRPLDGSGQKVQKEYRLMTLLIHSSQIQEVLQSYPSCPTDVKQWACSALPS